MDPKVQTMLQALKLDSEALAAQLRNYTFEQLGELPNAVMRDTLGLDTRTRCRIITYYSMFKQAKSLANDKNAGPQVALTPKRKREATPKTEGAETNGEPDASPATNSAKPRTPRSAKQTKSPRDPAAPKRFMTAYFFFAQKMRPEITLKNPGIDLVSASYELGRLWREMPESEKAVYKEQAAQDVARYRQETGQGV